MSSPEAKRARRIVFEPIRLTSIYNARTLNERLLSVQHAKLSERFRLMQRQVGELERRNQELETRRVADERAVSSVNRQWNHLNETMLDVMRRFRSPTNVEEFATDKPPELDWTTVLQPPAASNVLPHEAHNARVKFSAELLTALMKTMNLCSSKRDRIIQLLEEAAKASNRSAYSSSHRSLGGGSERGIFESQRADLHPNIFSTLRDENKKLASENKRLEAIAVAWKAEKTRMSTKIALQKEQLEFADRKAKNHAREAENLRTELHAAAGREEKLETAVLELSKQLQEQKEAEAAAPPACSTSKEESPVKLEAARKAEEVDSKRVLQLQRDLEAQREVAEKRLAEIQLLSVANQQLAVAKQDLENKLKFLPTAVIKTSPDFLFLQFTYAKLFDRCKQLDANNKDLRTSIEQLQTACREQTKAIKEEFQMALRREHEKLRKLTTELVVAKSEHKRLQLDFEQQLQTAEIKARNHDEFKLLLDEAQAGGRRKDEEIRRLNGQTAALQAEVTKTKDELEAARKVHETCIVIKLSANVPPPPLLLPKVDAQPPLGLPFGAFGCEPSGVELGGSLDLTLSLARILLQQLTHENETMRETIRAFHRAADDAGGVEGARQRIRELSEQNDALRSRLAAANQAEEGLVREMAVASAGVENLIQQNKKLLDRLGEQERELVGVLQSGIQKDARLFSLEQQRETLEQKSKEADNELQARHIETRLLEEKLRLLEQTIPELQQVNQSATTTVEAIHRSNADLQSEHAVLQLRFDKQTAELDALRREARERTAGAEASRLKIARLREERGYLRKKLTAKPRDGGEADGALELLEEENRTLRESLKCACCKTNEKDTVLTDCFHVFCGPCIQKRYESRNRKCPRCNATFGANGFRRIYIK